MPSARAFIRGVIAAAAASAGRLGLEPPVKVVSASFPFYQPKFLSENAAKCNACAASEGDVKEFANAIT